MQVNRASGKVIDNTACRQINQDDMIIFLQRHHSDIVFIDGHKFRFGIVRKYPGNAIQTDVADLPVLRLAFEVDNLQ